MDYESKLKDLVDKDLEMLEEVQEKFQFCCTLMNQNKDSVLRKVRDRIKELTILKADL